MVTYRLERLKEEIHHTVAEILKEEVHDPRVHSVVVTKVHVTRDLGLARIYYEATEPSIRKDLKEGLEKAKGYIRHALAGRLKLRLAPQIEFYYDETSEEVKKVEELFTKL